MSVKKCSLFSKSFLVLALLAGGIGAAQAASAGAEPAVVSPPPVAPPTVPAVKPTVPTVPAMKSAVPATPAAPAVPAMKPAVPATPATPAVPAMKPAPVTSSAPVAAGVAGNPDGSCPASAPVKVSRSKIYHVPEGRSYAKTKAKSCFVSAQAAEQAGYRAPKK